MFFIRVGSFVAWALIIISVLNVTLGLLIAFEFYAPSEGPFTVANSGTVIDLSLITFGVGLVIGLLVEIAKK